MMKFTLKLLVLLVVLGMVDVCICTGNEKEIQPPQITPVNSKETQVIENQRYTIFKSDCNEVKSKDKAINLISG